MQPDATRFQIAKMLHPPRPTRLNRMQPKSKKNARRTPGFMQRVGSPRGPLGGAHAGVKVSNPKQITRQSQFFPLFSSNSRNGSRIPFPGGKYIKRATGCNTIPKLRDVAS